ncbi:MAG: DNA replication/repair protein RecF [Bdellovibrionales bacterium]|nr:DNA replication/repair protein RecF [Bdellovibrionales bacterium]
MPLCLQKISLTNFRNYEALRLEVGTARQIVLWGANGAGKTNILEAVSLLTPGKGLRGAALDELTSRTAVMAGGHPPLWAVAAELESASGLPLRLGTGLDRPRGDAAARRVIRLDGKEVKGQRHLSEHVAAVWLTPQMDRIFLEGAAARRKFLDRLVFAYAPDHVTHLNRYDKNLRERLRLLTAHATPDPLWLNTLETQIAGDAVSIAAARAHLLVRLGYHLGVLSSQQNLFPAPRAEIICAVAAALQSAPALAVEQDIAEKLRRARAVDAAAGRATVGAHRADFAVTYAAKNMPADQCSTGEQKGLLLSIVLAHARMMQAEKGFVPLLLLDEVAAHLDDARRLQLFGHLESLGGQVWLTGTDAGLFAPLSGAAVFKIDRAQAIMQPRIIQGAGLP